MSLVTPSINNNMLHSHKFFKEPENITKSTINLIMRMKDELTEFKKR